jgi:serine/threonine-protein kinase
MADVWLARLHSKPDFERLFAIKTVLPREADSAVFRTMFLDEARLVSRIDHPNVVRVTDLGEYEGLPYLVMELIEGDALDKLALDVRRAGGTIPLGIALRIAADACNGLAAAHELVDTRGAPLNVVHRDVSPQNILVATNGIAKVIDFGIAKGRDRVTAQTSTGVLKGKASYMPREQACGEEVDARTDTWALGAVIYYLFAGHPPYKSDSELATLRMAITGADIRPLPPHIPALVRSLVRKALALDPAARFQSASELGAAVEAVMRELGAATSYNEVGSFVRGAMAGRLATRRELVSEALTSSAANERKRAGPSIPIEVDVDVDVEVERPSATVAGAVRSAWHGVVRKAWPSRARLAIGAVAALWVGIVAIIAFVGRGRSSSAAGVAPNPSAERVAGHTVPLPAAPPTASTRATAEALSASASGGPQQATAVTISPVSSAPSAKTHAALGTPERGGASREPAPLGPAKGASTPTKKSRDDEAGF